jgi:hypothetical protein
MIQMMKVGATVFVTTKQRSLTVSANFDSVKQYSLMMTVVLIYLIKDFQMAESSYMHYTEGRVRERMANVCGDRRPQIFHSASLRAESSSETVLANHGVEG